MYRYMRNEDYPEGLYDKITGLPSFNLFEDRLQMALINEKVKDARFRRLKIAVVGLKIENLASFSDDTQNIVLKQTADSISQLLPQNYTLARGINYQFWIMMPYLESKEEGRLMIEKIKTLVSRQFQYQNKTFQLNCRIGAVLFEHSPEDSVSTLIGKAIYALQQAEENNQTLVYFSDLVKS